MVTCSCGKTIANIPNWLNNAKVEFVCNNCPNRNFKNIAVMSMEIDQKLAGALSAATLKSEEPEDLDDED
jgi:hypothetical protein